MLMYIYQKLKTLKHIHFQATYFEKCIRYTIILFLLCENNIFSEIEIFIFMEFEIFISDRLEDFIRCTIFAFRQHSKREGISNVHKQYG